MRYLFAAAFATALLAVPWLATNYPAQVVSAASAFERAAGHVASQIAAVIISRKPKTVADLRSRYDDARASGNKKVKILIVPGHEPIYGGAEFGALKERDMNV